MRLIRAILIITFSVVVAMAVTLACFPDTQQVDGGILKNVERWHDDELNVTCWLYQEGFGRGISCIPDHLLNPESEGN